MQPQSHNESISQCFFQNEARKIDQDISGGHYKDRFQPLIFEFCFLWISYQPNLPYRFCFAQI